MFKNMSTFKKIIFAELAVVTGVALFIVLDKVASENWWLK